MHPLLVEAVRDRIESAMSRHVRSVWRMERFTDLDDRASHPCGVLHGPSMSVLAKYSDAVDAVGQFTIELAGLTLLRERAGIVTPQPVGSGVVELDCGAVMVMEAVDEVAPHDRTDADWRAIGRTLATVHQVRGDRHGLAFDNCFGPLPQDNRAVASNRWIDFYAQRRLLPRLRDAVDSGHLSGDLAARVERLTSNLASGRLDSLAGPEPVRALLHGDAQANNFVSRPDGAVIIDAAPFYGHPEYDLALLDCYVDVPQAVFDGYREIAPIDPGFVGRRGLWRLHASLAVVAHVGSTAFGQRFVRHISDTLDALK